MIIIGHQQHKYHIHPLPLALLNNRIQCLYPWILFVQQKRKFLQIGLRHRHHPSQIGIARYRCKLSLQIPQPPFHRVVIVPNLTLGFQSTIAMRVTIMISRATIQPQIFRPKPLRLRPLHLPGVSAIIVMQTHKHPVQQRHAMRIKYRLLLVAGLVAVEHRARTKTPHIHCYHNRFTR